MYICIKLYIKYILTVEMLLNALIFSQFYLLQNKFCRAVIVNSCSCVHLLCLAEPA